MKVSNFIANSKSLIKLAYPILIAQLVQNLMGFSDTVMAGRVSSTDMAAVAVANSIWFPIVVMIYGVIMALASIVAQLAGAKKFKDVIEQTYQAGWIALTLGIFLVLVNYLLTPLIAANVELEYQLKTLLFDYFNYLMWGVPAYCLYFVLRNYTEALSHTKPTMVISIIALLVNIPANYIFIYGKFGMPALGGAGCGIATALVYWCMFISLLIYCYFGKIRKTADLFSHLPMPNWCKIKNIFSLGLPISLSLLFEVSLYSVVSIILLPFGAKIVASHQIALNYTSMIYMVPLSLAMAATIKVGNSIGDNNFEKAKDYCTNSIILGLLLTVITATITVIFATDIAKIYNSEQTVVELAASLMLLCALYQGPDTVQVIAAGALRGYKDTKAILYISFVSYWLIGLSSGIVLGLTDWVIPQTGPHGFWIGFIIGLIFASALMARRLKTIQQRVKNNNQELDNNTISLQTVNE